MNINDLLEPEDWDSLGDDPEERFVHLLDIAFKKFDQLLEPIRSEVGVGSALYQRSRYDLQIALLNAAQAEEVEAFEDFELPPYEEYRPEHADLLDAKLTAWHARTKTQLRRRDSEARVRVSSSLARTMKADFEKVREAINGASLRPSKKADLLRRLRAIEDELNGTGSINVMKFVWLTTQLLMVPGGLVQSYQLIDGPLIGLMKSFTEAKAAEDVTRTVVFPLMPKQSPLALTHYGLVATSRREEDGDEEE